MRISGTVRAANTAPTALNSTVTTNEDTAYTFGVGDFNFSDTDAGDGLASVEITSLPASGKGSLMLDGSAVTADQVVSRADIDADELVYTPPANANGDDYASFGFKVTWARMNFSARSATVGAASGGTGRGSSPHLMRSMAAAARLRALMAVTGPWRPMVTRREPFGPRHWTT